MVIYSYLVTFVSRKHSTINIKFQNRKEVPIIITEKKKNLALLKVHRPIYLYFATTLYRQQSFRLQVFKKC